MNDTEKVKLYAFTCAGLNIIEQSLGGSDETIVKSFEHIWKEAMKITDAISFYKKVVEAEKIIGIKA